MRGNSMAFVKSVGDRAQLEEAEARELYRTYQATQQKVMTTKRTVWITRMYGSAALARIQKYMMEMHKGERL